jgi:hypothetical protein
VAGFARNPRPASAEYATPSSLSRATEPVRCRSSARHSSAFEHITRTILLLRGQRIILDAELAALYGVTTKALNQATSATPSGFRRTFCSASTAPKLSR